ncbi:hypothetical protein L7F22_013370 [Adiantum nelumboides]|nr:hypothetical protein [Adiantum nelumboides]
MLLQASLPDAYWEEATATACYIQNCIPSTRNPTTMPYTLWHGHPPHLVHLRIFGSIAYPLVTQPLSKLSPRAQRTIFVGYGDCFGIKAYRLYIQDHHKFIFARTIVYDEEFILSGKSSPPAHTTFSSPPSSVHSSHQSSLAASRTHTPMKNSYPFVHYFEPPLSIARLSFITHPPPHARRSHAQPIGNSPTPPLAPIPSQLTPLPTPAATTSITPQTLNTALSSLPLICRPRSPHSPTITSSPRQPPASSLRQSSFLLHGHSNMERPLQTARKSTTPSPLSPHCKPLPPLLPASPSPSPSFFRNSHVTSPSNPIPIDINKFESHNSTSTTSPPQHTLTLHLDQAASSLHGRAHSLCEIYEATSFSAVLANETILEHPQEPPEDALASSESKEWHAAILDELQALEATNTRELVPPPEHHNIVSCKWLLKKKYHPNGSVDRYKARLVARGFTQQEGVDYFDTYSPILGMTAFRVLIALAAKINLLLHHLDKKTAFLHGFLQELFYMLQPPHFEDPHHPDYVCKLNKTIYGLKQSAREWYIHMHHYLIKCGWEHLMADYNIYIWQTTKGMAILGLFVDDNPLLGTSEYMLLQAIDCISQEFPVTDKGPMTYFLGIEVIRDPAGKFIQLSQSKYIEELLFYGMSASAPELTPLPVKHKLAPKFHAYTRTDALYCPSLHFPKFCGQLRYLISCTRFDLCYTGHILSLALCQSPAKCTSKLPSALFAICVPLSTMPSLTITTPPVPSLFQDMLMPTGLVMTLDVFLRGAMCSLWLVVLSPGKPNDNLLLQALPQKRNMSLLLLPRVKLFGSLN